MNLTILQLCQLNDMDPKSWLYLKLASFSKAPSSYWYKVNLFLTSFFSQNSLKSLKIQNSNFSRQNISKIGLVVHFDPKFDLRLVSRTDYFFELGSSSIGLCGTF